MHTIMQICLLKRKFHQLRTTNYLQVFSSAHLNVQGRQTLLVGHLKVLL